MNLWICIGLILTWSLIPNTTSNAFSLSMTSTPTPHNPSPNIVILGGTGRIGTAVATHLLQQNQQCHVVLVGRSSSSSSSSQKHTAIQEVLKDSQADPSRLSLVQLPKGSSIWNDDSIELRDIVSSADCLIHTAGPYLNQKPVPLRLAIESGRCRAYVDVSDPLPFLEESLGLHREAEEAGVTALLAAGAFPGMSNVLAKHACAALTEEDDFKEENPIRDLRFNYFTAGLGGSGVVNLYITNLGFGEPMVQYHQGSRRFFETLSGSLLGQIDFFVPPSLLLQKKNKHVTAGNEQARQRVGRKTLFAWPFPEAATVPTNIEITGNSYAAMGTAPDIWNGMLGLLVRIVPRSWWRNESFSKFLADFSQPLVWLTDVLLLERSGVGELHAMRIDATTEPTTGGERGEKTKGVSSATIVQAHDSFRRCVGQSCAEFALDALGNPKPGVYLPEQRYDGVEDRDRIVERLTGTPGTFCYTGVVLSDGFVNPPSGLEDAVAEAM